MIEEVVGKIDVQKETIESVKAKQNRIINTDEIDMLKSKVTYIQDTMKEKNKKVGRKASVRYSIKVDHDVKYENPDEYNSQYKKSKIKNMASVN